MGCDVGHEFEARAFELWQHIWWWCFDDVDLAIEQSIGAGHGVRNRNQHNAIGFGDACFVPVGGVLHQISALTWY